MLSAEFVSEMKQTRALALLGSAVESPGMQGGSWWPYGDNSAFQGILIYGPQVVLDVLMDGSCTDPSKIQNNNKSALCFNKNVLSVATATYTQQFYSCSHWHCVYLFVGWLLHFKTLRMKIIRYILVSSMGFNTQEM